jgi:HEAT repeat protein
MATDNESLMAYLRRHSADVDRLVLNLIRDLGSDEFEVREHASAQLVALGEAAVPRLREHKDSHDPEVARRVKECLTELARLPILNVPLIVTRLLVQRQVEAAVPVLIEHLGNTADPDVEEEIYYGLEDLAVKDGHVHPALEAALADANSSRRAAAACLLGRLGDARVKAKVRQLLNDPDARVRLRAAQALLASHESAAVQVLIELLKEPSAEVGWQAEELLHWVAGTDAPDATFGAGSPPERDRSLAAWQRWWAARRGVIDWSEVERDCRRPGLVLLSNAKDAVDTQIQFRLCGCDGIVRYSVVHRIDPVPYAYFGGTIQLGWWSGKGFLLPVPEEPIRLREVDIGGKTIWESVPLPKFRQHPYRRLGDGRTVVYDDREIMVLDERGAVVSERRYHKDKDVIDSLQYFRMGKEGRMFIEEISKADRTLREYDTGSGELLAKEHMGDELGDNNRLLSRLRSDNHDYDLAEELQTAALGGGNGQRLRHGNLLLGHVALRGNDDFAPVELDGDRQPVWEGPRWVWRGYTFAEVAYPLVRFGFRHSASTEASLDTVPSRIAQLRSRSPDLRLRAASRLLRHPSKVVGKAFSGCLRDADAAVRACALDGLFWSREYIDDAISGMASLLDDPIREVWARATENLGLAGPEAVRTLVRLAGDRTQSEVVRHRATLALTWHVGEDDRRVLRVVRAALKESAREGREEIVIWIGMNIKRGGAELIPDLVQALHDPDGRVSMRVAYVLGKFGPAAEKVVPELINALKDRRSRAAGAHVLGDLRARSPGVIQGLLDALKDKDDLEGRCSVISALPRCAARGEDVVPVLIEALSDRDVDEKSRVLNVQLQAMSALAALGPSAKSAVPALLRIVKQTKVKQDVRMKAWFSLREIDSEAGEVAERILRSGK